MLSAELASGSVAQRKLDLIALLCVLLGASLLLGWPSTANAELIVRVGDAQVLEGQSGFFDVYFSLTDGTLDLKAYMIELGLSGPGAGPISGVRFTHFAEPADPLVPGRVPAQVPNRPELPGTIAAAWDLFPQAVPLRDGAGLLRVYFEAEPGSLGQYQVTIDPDLLRTNFSNGAGRLLSDLTTIGYAGGRLEVVPEPSAAAMLVALLACAALARRRIGS